MRLAALLALAACLGACNAEQPAQPEAQTPAASFPDSNALTAEGWGPLRIGMTREEVVASLGADAHPGAVGGPDPEACDEFRPERAPEGVLVMIEQGVLTRIAVGEGASLKTDRGFGVGDSAAAIKAAYGASAVAAPHKYASPPAEYITVWANRAPDAAYVEDPAARGIVYEIGEDGRVRRVFVGGPSIQYVEGCA